MNTVHHLKLIKLTKLKIKTRVTPHAIQVTPRRPRILKTALFLTMVALLTGCGASTTPRNAASLNGAYNYNGGPLWPGTNAAQTQNAECNAFDMKDIRMQGKVTTYYQNSQIQEDKVRLRITGLADHFDTTSTVYFQFFRWKASTANQAEIDNAALSFKLHKGSTNTSEISTEVLTSLNSAKLASIRTSVGMTGSSSLDFFSQNTIVISGVDYNWQALKIVLYDGDTVLGQTDLLLPVFSANPNTYAANHALLLSELHPFWAQRTQAMDWVTTAWNNCF